MNLVKMSWLRAFLAVSIVVFGASIHAHAQGGCTTGGTGCGSNPPPAPELDASLAAGGVALLGGTVLLVRKLRRK